MPFQAILFDCDGVLVDSEPITMRVLRDCLAESGWDMPLAECMARFVGVTVRSRTELIEARTGQPLTDGWMDDFYARRNAALAAELQAVPGAVPAVQALHARLDGRLACASGADRHKVEMQLRQVGLAPYFGPHVFSGHEMPRSKPAPDVYLAAAAALEVAPARCLVVEDTPTGVQAGVSAGAAVWGYCPPGADGAALRAAGALQLFDDMGALPALMAAATLQNQ